MEVFSIGQVARLSGVGVETVRFYERETVLEAPARRASGYCQYTEEAVKQIRFIKRAQLLGFSLKEIRELLLIYTCEVCFMTHVHKSGDCCVFCSYGDKPCPSMQEGETCCSPRLSDQETTALQG